ncbi:MAG: AI-2E family transporter [Calditrichaceae bacterium]|nr:AI-2E family transporter [Calditrichaceae bacterium]MBN2707948.1 AI-2E family transporter [Calditrichaceae bacterium]RQV95950.1 MAG: AI-2E family transporter [Calditrichota bacterium]
MNYSPAKIIKFVLLVCLLALFFWLASILQSTVTILIISFLIAYILDPLASYFERKWLNRMGATVVVFLFIAVIIGAIFSFLLPPVLREIQVINNNLGTESSMESFQKIELTIRSYLPFISPESLNIREWISRILDTTFSSIISIIGSVVSIVTTMVIIPFAVFFLLKDGRKMKKAFVSLIPNRYFEMVLNIMHKTDEQLGGYLRGQFFDAAIVGILATIAMWILGVPYYSLIGIFAGLSNMIPYVGPLVGGAAGVSVVFFTNGDSQLILLVIGAFVIIQLLDNVLIQPLVVARSVNLHPLLIIFVVIIGGQFFGILGMLLAVPATGVLKVLLLEFYNGFRKYKLL